MATKAKSHTAPKSAPLPPQAPLSPLAGAFSKAMKLVDSGKHAEAAKALGTLIHEAQATGDWAVKRRAQIYLTLAESHLHAPKVGPTDAVAEIEACLNRHDPAGAIKLLDKALKSHPTQAILHYMKAVAHAQTEQVEASAESMKKAMDLDPDLVFQWHMEPDFNSIRKSALFGFTEGR